MLQRLADAAFIVAMLPLGVCMAAVAASVLRTRALPAWLGWSAAVTAVLLVANSLDLASDFGPAFLLYLLWVLAAAIVLLRRAMTVPSPSGARAPQRFASARGPVGRHVWPRSRGSSSSATTRSTAARRYGAIAAAARSA